MAPTDPPSPQQQRYLRSLAQKTGTTFTPPTTRAEAGREIRRLKRLGASPAHERREDRKAVADGLECRGDQAAVRDDEIDGWGSTATWR